MQGFLVIYAGEGADGFGVGNRSLERQDNGVETAFAGEGEWEKLMIYMNDMPDSKNIWRRGSSCCGQGRWVYHVLDRGLGLKESIPRSRGDCMNGKGYLGGSWL